MIPKKILCIGDFHCGDNAGLTPPSQVKPGSPFREAQEKLWAWYVDRMAEYDKFDACILMGDMTEGQNNKNTIELYETDTERQAEIAAECCEQIPCDKENFFAVYGTPFHTAGSYSFENHFADYFGIKRPKNTLRLNIDNLVRVNVRHTVGRSSIPYGQGTPTYKEMVNEILNAALQEDTSADICLRGHAHYSVSMRVRDHESIVVPCLKYPGSVFGRKLPESQYDMGFGVLFVYGLKDWRYVPIHVPFAVSSKREWTDI